MGWDRGRYYTRSKKIQGRVVREYVGIGPVAELLAEGDIISRRERETKQAAYRADRQKLSILDSQMDKVNERIDMLANAVLIAAGFRRHNRGEWRKKRVQCH